MESKPILFSSPMVRAILSGTKTQTRRLKCPYRVGDLLWVRETFRHYGNEYHNGQAYALIMYKDGRTSKIPVEVATQNNWSKWTPSIHMPRWASRLTLEVTGVRVERVRDITEEDALAEGVQPDGDMRWNPVQAYKALWSSIHGPSLWAENPFCWVYNIKRVEVEGGQ